MSERKPVWYWVKACASSRWEPSMWEDGFFELDRDLYKPAALEEIGPRIPTPDEPWQCAPKEPTQDMLRASLWSGSGDVSINEDWARRETWKRMVLAAPSPEDV